MAAGAESIPGGRAARSVGVAVASNASAIVGAVGIAALIHFVVAPLIGPFNTGVSLQVGVAIILAVSLNIVNGFTGQFSMGHAGFAAVGGYIGAAVTFYGGVMLWGTPDRHGGFLGWGEWLMVAGCLAGAGIAAVFGYIVGLPSLRLRGDYLAIVTLGFGEIIRVLLQQTNPQVYSKADLTAAVEAAASKGEWFWIPPPLGGSQGMVSVAAYANPFWVFLFAAVTCIIAYRLKNSSAGRAFLSIREDEIAAQAMGVNLTKYKVRAFVIAAFLAGIGGGLYAHTGVPMMPKEAGFMKSFDLVIMVVLGGMGSISGTVLAAAILAALPDVLRELMPGAEKYRLIVYALALILMMILRPQGLFGIREIWDLGRRRKARPGGGKGAA